MSSLSDLDAALALAGIRSPTAPSSPSRAPDRDEAPTLRSIGLPGHRFGYPGPRTRRARRRPVGLGAGDHGSATLLNAHRAGATEVPPPAA